ncbi:PKD domain-containing protein [Natronomonas sp.]|uniref:PKD domain-containing protein n=1 Tax=Natronomonas sp. TaxID=2184060 RepID=UPI0039771087
MACLTVITAIGLGGIPLGTVEADDGAPGEPASFFGTAVDEDGNAIPSGTTIVAVVNGEAEGEITVDSEGRYGGEEAFDDKLRIDSAAGEEVTFRFADSDGPNAESAQLEAGVFERNLTFPANTVEYIHPDAVASVDPAAIAPDGEIILDGSNSTAHESVAIDAYRWEITRDGNAVATLDGEAVSKRFEVNGTYDVELTVTDEARRTNRTQTTFEVDPTLETDETGDSSSSETTGTRSTSTVDSDASNDPTTGGEAEAETVGSSSGGGGKASSGRTASGGGTADGSASDAGETDSELRSVPKLKPGAETSGGFVIPEDPVAEERVEIEDGAPDAPGTVIGLGDPTIREIVLQNDSASGNLSVWEFDSTAGESPPLPNDLRVVSVSIITVPAAYRNESAIFRAFVDPGWLAENELRPHELSVYRLPDSTDEWQPLPTEATDVDGEVLVEAETPGFSQFVIAGPIAPERTGEPRTDSVDHPNSREPDETGETAVQKTSEGSDESGERQPFAFDESMLDRPTAALIALLVVTGLVGWIFIPRRRR